jgi:lipoprotein-anchoring transpeptidase ErfK/SrfK
MQYPAVASAFLFVPLAILAADPAQAQSFAAPAATPPLVVVAQPQEMRGDLGGGFIEFLFGGGGRARRSYPAQGEPRVYVAPPVYGVPAPQPVYANVPPQADPMLEQQRPDLQMDPQFLPREVAYNGTEKPGTIIVDTPHHFLYLVEEGGKARRYGVGVGRPGFTWSGEHKITAKKEWPDWVPPEEMLQRQPYLPHFMPGGPNNPLGARALYIGSTLYRIHGSNEPWTIGHNVSSGCIRMRNQDVIDLYNRVKVGTKVVVLPMRAAAAN